MPDPILSYQVQLSLSALKEWSRWCGYPLLLSLEMLDELPQILSASQRFGNREFCFAPTYHPTLVSEAAYRGIFPMSITLRNTHVMLLKLHTERCVMPPSEAKIKRSVRRDAKRYTFTLDQRPEEVLRLINANHKDNWLVPPLWRSFQEINAAPQKHRGMKIHSFEVYDAATGKLAAGELGFIIGGIYTSLSGAFDPAFSGAGSVQLAVTASLLRLLEFRCWDLGMVMDYKTALGGKSLPRQEWQAQVAQWRDLSIKPLWQQEPRSCRVLIDEAGW